MEGCFSTGASSRNKRPFVLSRAGYPGIQRYALGWSGDNRADYEHLRHNIRLGISVMMSGQVNYGHDVGGFVGHPDGTLYTRWHEWARGGNSEPGGCSASTTLVRSGSA